MPHCAMSTFQEDGFAVSVMLGVDGNDCRNGQGQSRKGTSNNVHDFLLGKLG